MPGGKGAKCPLAGDRRARRPGVRSVIKPVLCADGAVARAAPGTLPEVPICLHGVREINLVGCSSSMHAPSKSTASLAGNSAGHGISPRREFLDCGDVSPLSFDATCRVVSKRGHVRALQNNFRRLTSNPRNGCGSFLDRSTRFSSGAMNFLNGRESSWEGSVNFLSLAGNFLMVSRNFSRRLTGFLDGSRNPWSGLKNFLNGSGNFLRGSKNLFIGSTNLFNGSKNLFSR